MVKEMSWKSHGTCKIGQNVVVSHEILPILARKCTKFVCFFATSKKLSIDVESLRFPTYSAKCRECKIAKRDDYGKLTNGHGKVMEKNIVKSLGTLVHIPLHVPSNQLPLPHFPNSIFHTGRVQTGSSLQYAYSIG